MKSGKVYRIVCQSTGLQYIGSTSKNVSTRLQKHLNNYYEFLKGKYHFISSFNVLKNNNYKVDVLENYEYENIHELRKRERFYIECFECVNLNIPSRTKKEWCEVNKEKLNKKYNCLCGGKYTYKHITDHLKTLRHREYIEKTEQLHDGY